MYIGTVNRQMGASNININYDATGVLTAVCKVTLRSSRLGFLSWTGRGGVVDV